MSNAVNIGRLTYRKVRSALGIAFELGKVKFNQGFSIEPPCVVSSAVDFKTNVTIGAYGYIAPTDGIGKFLHNCDIGRYCSIAAGVWIAPGDHPTQWISSSSFQYDRTAFDSCVQALRFDVPPTRRWVPSSRVSIGNDVWIGHDAFVRQGVKIGDGAIVAAHAVVTKDVPPYAIVGGCPAKVIKYRFDEQTIKELQRLQWWNYNAADFGDVDWSDVHEAIVAIKNKIASGMKPWHPRPVTSEDLSVYSRSKLFFVDVSGSMVRVKLFGVWLVHWVKRP